MIRRAKAAGIKSVPTGIEHGTVTLVVDAQPFEVTTLREDTETFGRKAKVAFGRDWVADAERRDFTINGLSVDADGVRARSRRRPRRHRRAGACASSAIRTSASPRTICASCGFSAFTPPLARANPIAPAISPAFAARAGLATLSAERVRMEMLKLVVAEGAAGAIAAMADGGLLLPIFGGVAYTGPFAAMIAAERRWD